MPDFQGEYEFHTYRSVEDHLEGPGLLQEQHTHGLRLQLIIEYCEFTSNCQIWDTLQPRTVIL